MKASSRQAYADAIGSLSKMKKKKRPPMRSYDEAAMDPRRRKAAEAAKNKAYVQYGTPAVPPQGRTPNKRYNGGYGGSKRPG